FVPRVQLTPSAFMLGAAAGLLVMLSASVLALWRARSSQAVRELVGGGRSGQTVGASRLSRALVVLQAALGMMLLMVALLFAHSQQGLAHANLGIRADHVISTTITPPLSLYPNVQALNTLARQVIARMRAIPGARFVGALNVSPVGGYVPLRLQSSSPTAEHVNYQFLQGDLLRALGVPLLRGRLFDRTDHAGGAAVAVVNEAFVQRHMHGNPLGQQVRFDLRAYGLPDEAVTVVGVVGNIKTFGPSYPAPGAVYVPMAQVPPRLLLALIDRLHFEAAVSGSPITYADAMRQAVLAVAPQLAVQHARPLSERVLQLLRAHPRDGRDHGRAGRGCAAAGQPGAVRRGQRGHAGAVSRVGRARGAWAPTPRRLILHVLR
ncbi:permease, partial [mine drainage metagenome]